MCRSQGGRCTSALQGGSPSCPPDLTVPGLYGREVGEELISLSSDVSSWQSYTLGLDYRLPLVL